MNKYYVICEDETVYLAVSETPEQACTMARNEDGLVPCNHHCAGIEDPKAPFSVRKLKKREKNKFLKLYYKYAALDEIRDSVQKEIDETNRIAGQYDAETMDDITPLFEMDNEED